ncbi:MAG TPA: RNA polymerase sigma factor [Candidatus Kapabacteria bacterium]|nr:RNA polymerase sigma factor [Candidatus Kapabacteria bacterium]
MKHTEPNVPVAAASTPPGVVRQLVDSSAFDARHEGAVHTRAPWRSNERQGPAGHVPPGVQGDVGNDLMLALQRGERPALERLFSLYNPKLYSFIHRIVGDANTAEDIVQETWMTLYERRAGYQPTYRFSTWLFTIARRKALSELRRRSVRSVVRSLTMQTKGGEQEEMEMPQTTFFDPAATTDGAILGRMVQQALARLSNAQREVVVLRDIEGFEPEEIAAILQWNVKPGALRKRIFDAREAFRRAMLALGYHEQLHDE